MLTRIATAALAVSLLGASAFALAPLQPVTGPAGAAQPGETVMHKNSAWPLKDRMSMDPCTVTMCQEA
ncbi:MAG: hypothetical protein ACOC9Q_02950 [bacterium]